MARLMAASSFMCRRWLSQMLITRPPYCGSSPSSGPRLDRHARRYYPMASTACTAGAIDPDEEEAPRVSAAAESHPHISRGKTAAAGQSLGPCALCSSWRNPDPRLAAPPRRSDPPSASRLILGHGSLVHPPHRGAAETLYVPQS